MKENVLEILNHTEALMKKSIVHLQTELVKIRAGKATPQILDGIMVDYYQVSTPINQVANIAVPDANSLAVQPWEKSMIEPIEKAILQANIGLNPQNDGTFIRIKIPPLTEERRKELVKQAKTETENTKISIRNIRRDSNDKIRKFVKEGLAEDAARDAESKVQELTNGYIKQADSHLEVKEKEILTI